MNTAPANRTLIVLGTIITQMGLGTIYTWSLFNQSLVEKFDWSLSSVSMTFSLTSFFLAFATLFAGRFQERIGIRTLTIIAGIALGLGLIGSAQATSLTMIYLLAGVLVGFADGTAYITTLSNLIKWFPQRKGLIAGISVGAYGTGSLLFKFINGALIAHLGASQAFFWWGIMAMALIITGGLLLKDAPVAPVQNTQHVVQKDFTVRQMLGTQQAWLLFIMFFTACMSGLYLIGIAKDIGVRMAGLDAATAANAVLAIAICNTSGRLILGSLSDRMNRMHLISLTMLLTALAVTALVKLPLNLTSFFLCVGTIAFCFGGNITIFPAIVGDFFGLRHHSKNYGLIYQGFGFGALFGSFVAALLGGMHVTFFVIIGMAILSFIISLFIKPPRLA